MDESHSAIEFYAEDHRHQVAAAGAPEQSAHSPRLKVVQREIGAYRNDVLGLPNFVGFVPDRTSRRRAA